MLFACAFYFLSLVLSLVLSLPLVFDLDFARAGDLALLEDLDLGREAALLRRPLPDGIEAGADGAAWTPTVSPATAPSGPNDRPRCSAVSWDSKTRSCRNTS